MNERSLLPSLLALNVALLVALLSCLVTARNEPSGAQPASISRSNAPTVLPRTPPAAEPAIGVAQRALTSPDVAAPSYFAYLKSLERLGCPEHHRRTIVLADVDELFARKRLEEAIRHDFEWWRAEPQPIVASLLHPKGVELREERAALLKTLLHDVPAEIEKGEFWSIAQLTGPILGALPPKIHFQVQEVCARWMQPTKPAPSGADTAAADEISLAQKRERFRNELAAVLTAEQFEEFSIRFASNAVKLRDELRPLQPTAGEFRNAFRATDSIDREMQLEYGSIRALSQIDRERYLRRRQAALEQVLGPGRFRTYAASQNQG